MQLLDLGSLAYTDLNATFETQLAEVNAELKLVQNLAADASEALLLVLQQVWHCPSLEMVRCRFLADGALQSRCISFTGQCDL